MCAALSSLIPSGTSVGRRSLIAATASRHRGRLAAVRVLSGSKESEFLRYMSMHWMKHRALDGKEDEERKGEAC